MADIPDYSNPTHWLVRPEIEHFWPAPLGAKPADLFYIHPTTAEGPGWNQDFAETHPDRRADRAVLIRQISAFATVCNVFAPRYRQATSLAFRMPGTAADAAYGLAYEDIQAAFRHYLRHDNAGRGFILCGHSQGALHVGRLLAEVIEADGLLAPMIAAYAIGIGFSEGLFGTRYRHLAPCTGPRQTARLISWNCFLKGADPSAFLRRTVERDAIKLAGTAPGLPLCINPISFDGNRPEVDEAENPGTMPGIADGLILPPLVPGLAGARCGNGVAWVSPVPDAAYGLLPLPGGNMHLHEIALFYAALKADAARRTTAYASCKLGTGNEG